MSYQNRDIDAEVVIAVAADIKRNTIVLYEIPLMQVAAILTEAEIDYFVKMVNKAFGIWPNEEAKSLLISNSTFIEERSVYSLDDTIRNKVLMGMSPEKIRALAKRIEPASTDVMQKLYLDFILGKAKGIESMTLDELVSTYNIAQWCKNTSIRLPNLELVNIRIRQKELQLPLLHFTRDFNGRQKELKRLKDYYKLSGGFFGAYLGKLIELKPVKKPVFITGIGGTGKTTLVSQSILLQLARSKGKAVFIYIDFDRPGISIANVFSLLIEALRQWAIQVPQFGSIFESTKELIEDEYGGKSRNAGSVSSIRGLLYEKIFTKETLELLEYLKEPVIVVFDSFEELQYRANQSDIQPLFDLLRELGEYIPQLRPVFVGRSVLNSNVTSFEKIDLSGFDEPSAASFLRNLGIADRLLQQHIYKTFGNSPLTLRLAANLILKQIGKGPLTFEAVEKRGLFLQIDQTLIQEELVVRNLEHIHAQDKRVRQIAVPGILVRKLNPEVILEVLATPCRLGSIDIGTARKLFKQLKRVSFLFDDHGGEITFRQDLRRALYPRILNASPDLVHDVHNAAVAYYEYKEDVSDKAEYLYHCLMRGDDPAVIDNIYTPSMKPYIEKAVAEFPEKAYLHFAVVFGLDITDSKLQSLPLPDWDVYMRRKVKEVLRKGDKEQLFKIGQLFEQRTDRWENSKVWRDEVRILFRLNNNARLSSIIQPMIDGMKDNTEDWLFSRLVQHKKAEYSFLWERVAVDLKQKLPQYNYSSFQTVFYLLHYTIQLYRGDCRLGNNVENSTRSLIGAARRMEKLLKEEHGNVKRFFSCLPHPYVYFFEQEYKKHAQLAGDKMQSKVDFFITYLIKRRLYFRSAEACEKISNYFIKNYPTVTDLERYLKRNFRVFLKDITEPGVYQILLYEVILFVEIHSEFELASVISNAGIYYKIHGKLPVTAFIQNDEVIRHLSKLKFAFQKQDLNISDLRDEEGYQYVNLVLNAQGMHGFALLGFTYVMEEMGIRFNQISGAGAGALHAAFLAAATSEDGSKSLKLLKRYSEQDFRKLRDGKRVYNKFFIDLVSKGSKLIWVTTFCLVSLFLISLLFIKVMDISWAGNTMAKNVFFGLGLCTCIVVYIFVLKLFRLNRGEGINSGKALNNWIRSIFYGESILTIDDLERRVQAEDRFSPGKDLTPEFNSRSRLKMVAVEMVTLRKVVFPEMYDLFRDKEYKNTLLVADIIHACMASPVFFKMVSIKNIPDDSESVTDAWGKRFGITEVPSTAYLSATGISPIIRDDGKGGPPLLPCFGAFVERYRYNKKPYNNGLNAYFARLIRRAVEADEQKRGDETIIFKRGITRISINSQRYHSLNYGLMGEEKIELFIKGVAAATEFLLHFDWNDYKQQLTIIRTQRKNS